MKQRFLVLLVALCGFATANAATAPNLLIIYADDMGFGDVRAFGNASGTTSTVPTPKMDQLAAEGMMFTQAHSSSAVCTPSRYGILTGRYSWRLAGDGVLPSGIVGLYGNPIIRQGEKTIAQFLKEQGYATAAFGKWHLGAQFFHRDGTPFTGNETIVSSPADIDLHRVEGHAVAHGFDHFSGVVETINRPPYAYMLDDKVLFNGSVPAPGTHPWTWRTNLAAESIDGVGDPNAAQIDYSPKMIDEAEAWIAAQAATPEKPFFAYVSLYSPHAPHLPTPDFQGSVGFTFGDFLHETDHWIGRVLAAVDNNPALANTIVVLTSDNGPETHAFTASRNNGHDANGPFRGVKRDSWEGGTRVPFIVRWPGHITPGSTTTELVWQGDIFSTIAEVLGVPLPTNVAPDGESFLPVLQGKPKPSTRRDSIVLASAANQLSLKTTEGWKLIDGTGSGGNATSYAADNTNISNASGTVGGSPKQLFNLTTDLGETTNLQASEAAKRAELLARLETYRSTPTSHPYTLSTTALSGPVQRVIVSQNDTDRTQAPAALGDGWFTGAYTATVRQRTTTQFELRTQTYLRFSTAALAGIDPASISGAKLILPQIGRLNTTTTGTHLEIFDVNTPWDTSENWPIWNLGREAPSGIAGIQLIDYGSASYQINGTVADTSNSNVEGNFVLEGAALANTVRRWLTGSNDGLLVTLTEPGLAGLAFGTPTLEVTTSTAVTSYDLWRESKGLSMTQGFEDDADSDGVPNGLEWLYGTDPRSTTSGLGVLRVEPGTRPRFVFPRAAETAGKLDLILQWGTDLTWPNSLRIGGVNFEGGSTAPSVEINTPMDGQVTVSFPDANYQQLFSRLRVVAP